MVLDHQPEQQERIWKQLKMANTTNTIPNTSIVSVTDFISSTVVSNDPTLSALTSGLLSVTDGSVQVDPALLNLNNGIPDTFLSQFYSGNASANTLTLNYDQLNSIDSDQQVASTVVDPTTVPITSTPSSPTLARAASNVVTSIAETQPSDISVTPVGIEPPLAYKGQYPYVHTQKSESGHIKEIDDTPGNERLFDYHKSGTYQEIAADGRRVTKVVGDNYSIVVHDDHVYIEGSQDVYVKGNINITCLNDVNINVGGRLEINAKEDVRIRGSAIYLEAYAGDINMYSSGNTNMHSTRDTNIFSNANVQVQSAVGSNFTSQSFDVKTTQDVNLYSGANVQIQSTTDTNIKSGAGIFSSSTNDTNIKSSGAFIVSATSDSSVKSSSTVAFDGSHISLNEGISITATDANPAAQAIGATDAKTSGLSNPPSREGTVPAVTDSIIQGTDDDQENAQAQINAAVASGRITQAQADVLKTEPPTTGQTDTSPAANIVSTGTTGGIENLPDTSISGDLRLSKNYRLSDLTSPGPVFPYAIVSQVAGGSLMSKARLAANLTLLAQNVLEPINQKWGPIRINSGLRTGANIGAGQHGTGQAVDITFGARSSDYKTMYEIAQWIKDNIAFDQLILEYGASQIWIHISFASPDSGCKFKANRKMILTCANAPTGDYKPGLIEFAWSPK